MVGDALHLKGRHDGARVEEVRVIAHFTQLHQNVDDAHVVATRKGLLCSEIKSDIRLALN